MAERRGGAVALEFPESGERICFGDWFERSRRLAGGLESSGLRPGDHLALLAETRAEWPVVQGAAALLGAVLVPLNTHYRREDLGVVLARSRARVLVMSPRFRSNDYLSHIGALRDQLPELERVVLLEGEAPGCIPYANLAGSTPIDAFAPAGADSVGSLQYTSGTTGFPKGALLTHGGMLQVGWSAATRLKVSADDRWTSIIPLFHCAGCIMNLLGCLQTGARYVGVSYFDPVHMFDVIEKARCTVLSGVPTSYLAMLEHPAREDFDLSTLRTGTCGGADTDPGVLRQCAERFPIPHVVQVYGQTESSTLVACPRCDDPLRFETAGEILDGLEARVTDPQTGAVLSAGTLGQIEARGVPVMLGYFEDPQATAEALSPDGWLKTGDLGYLREDGRLVVAGGRLRDLIIRGGENIYPVEIENLIRGHPAVEEVAVFGLPDRYYGEVVAAAVKLKETVSAESIASHCKDAIARFKVPSRWFEVKTFPQTSSGKVRKVELQQAAANGGLKELS